MVWVVMVWVGVWGGGPGNKLPTGLANSLLLLQGYSNEVTQRTDPSCTGLLHDLAHCWWWVDCLVSVSCVTVWFPTSK